MTHSKGRINYAQRLKAIRPFVDFDYDLRQPLSSAAKAQITAYYGYIQKLTVRQHQIYRSSNADHLKAVQRFAQHDPKRFGRLTVAFVPNPTTERMKIKIDRKGRVSGAVGAIRKIEIPLDPVALVAASEGAAGDLLDYIDSVIDASPSAKRYVVQAGEFEVPSARERPFITEYVADLMSRYNSDKFDINNKSSHHFANWMFGITGYNFADQESMSEYRRATSHTTRARARQHVAQNRAEKRVRENPPGFWINDTLRAVKRARPPQPEGWRQVKQRAYYTAIYRDGWKEIKDRTSKS